MWEIGSAKKDITCFINGVGMFGYGMHFHRVKGIETRLFARAFTFKDSVSEKKTAYVSAEILSCTTSLRRGVLKKLHDHFPELGYHDDSIMIAGTHTHSAPGGYSHYALYNITVPGFVQKVYETLVNGITEAIVEADKNMKPGKIYFGSGEFAPEIDVAFNRSLKAYNRNPDVLKQDEKNRHLAINRKMYLLRMDDLGGNPIGTINWFGVHPTSVGNDYFKICGDNKGYAADYFEEYLKNSFPGRSQADGGAVAAFSQEACGDVSPNFVWSRKRKRMRGKFVDDYESAKYNGSLQFGKAKEIFENALRNEITRSHIDCRLVYEQFGNIAISPEFANGKEDQRTGPPCLGVSFFEGITDGFGIPKFLGNIVRVWTSGLRVFEKLTAAFSNKAYREKIFTKYDTQGEKHIMMETSDRRILGTPFINDLIIPSWADKTIFFLKEQYKSGGLDEKPWAPNVLPLQIIILGNVAIAGIPAEISTVSGTRIRNTILEVLKKRGVEHVVLSGYTNAYSGYITTYEEYQEQCYEGGHTLYGEWTSAAYQVRLKELSAEMLKEPGERSQANSTQPVEFSEDDLKKRMFSESISY